MIDEDALLDDFTTGLVFCQTMIDTDETHPLPVVTLKSTTSLHPNSFKSPPHHSEPVASSQSSTERDAPSYSEVANEGLKHRRRTTADEVEDQTEKKNRGSSVNDAEEQLMAVTASEVSDDLGYIRGMSGRKIVVGIEPKANSDAAIQFVLDQVVHPGDVIVASHILPEEEVADIFYDDEIQNTSHLSKFVKAVANSVHKETMEKMRRGISKMKKKTLPSSDSALELNASEITTETERTKDDATLVTVVRIGDPATTLCALAEEVDAKLVVVGTRNQGLMKRLIKGTVSGTVLDTCKRPVAVIKH